MNLPPSLTSLSRRVRLWVLRQRCRFYVGRCPLCENWPGKTGR